MMDKLYLILTNLGINRGQDKILHLIVGFIVGAVVHYFTLGTLWALVAVIAVGVGKEIYDLNIKKTMFDFFDMFATLLGGWLGIMAVGLLI